MNQYGIDIQTLDTFVGKPASKILVEEPNFRLERLSLPEDGRIELPGDAAFESTLWVEEGRVTIGGVDVGAHEAITLPPKEEYEVKAKTPTIVYLFLGFPDPRSEYLKKTTSSDYRDKYWGTIESIVSKDYAGKRMLVKKGGQASFEYHCKKIEGYYIHSGRLLLRFRAGRGEDRFFELEAGQTVFIPPGLMHQRGGLEDTVIIEISTRDDDSDSFLVEDGQKIPMPRLRTMVFPKDPKKKTLCFDIDGCICTATDGDYENAQPIRDAVDLINNLYAKGHYILLFSSRFMGRTHSNPSEAYAIGYDFTRKQLADWGVRYHELQLGKPRADIFIDDRAVFFENDWTKIGTYIKDML